MLRIIGILILFVLCCLIGMDRSSRLRERVRTLDEIRALLSYISQRIMYGRDSTRAILDDAVHSNEYNRLTFLEDLGSLQSFKTIDEKDRHKLSEFFDCLGTVDSQGESELIACCSEHFAYSAAQARAEYEKKGKLYRSLGMLAGATVAVLLI